MKFIHQEFPAEPRIGSFSHAHLCVCGLLSVAGFSLRFASEMGESFIATAIGTACLTTAALIVIRQRLWRSFPGCVTQPDLTKLYSRKQ